MTKHKKVCKCAMCRKIVNKKLIAYFEGNKVCQRCFERLKKPIVTSIRHHWLDKFIKEREMHLQ